MPASVCRGEAACGEAARGKAACRVSRQSRARAARGEAACRGEAAACRGEAAALRPALRAGTASNSILRQMERVDI